MEPPINAIDVPVPGVFFHAVQKNGGDYRAGVIWQAVASDDHVVVADATHLPANSIRRRVAIPRRHFDFFLVGQHVLAAMGLAQPPKGV